MMGNISTLLILLLALIGRGSMALNVIDTNVDGTVWSREVKTAGIPVFRKVPIGECLESNGTSLRLSRIIILGFQQISC